MSEDGFRLPASSYEELTKIIKGYGSRTLPAVPEDIKLVTGISPTTVSRNNAFLLASGILEGGKKKIMTPKGRALSRALEHEMPTEITKCWKEIVLSSDFFEKLTAAVRIRKGMDESSLKSHIAYTAGLPKKPEVMTGAGAVLEILLASNILKEEDGKYLVVTQDESGSSNSVELSQQNNDDYLPMFSAGNQVSHPHTNVALNNPIPSSKPGLPNNIGVSIQINIQCSAVEVEELGPRIAKLISDISNQKHTPFGNEELTTEVVVDSGRLEADNSPKQLPPATGGQGFVNVSHTDDLEV